MSVSDYIPVIGLEIHSELLDQVQGVLHLLR